MFWACVDWNRLKPIPPIGPRCSNCGLPPNHSRQTKTPAISTPR
jgi:hypothetical protein